MPRIRIRQSASPFRPRLVVTASSSPDTTDTRHRHWKAGEFPFPTTSNTPRRSARTSDRPPRKPVAAGEKEDCRRRHWNEGEFPDTPEDSGQRRRSPIKNVKKRLDARAEAKAWACTVTEALADRIDAKNWQEALQPDVYTYNTLIKACVDASRFDMVDAMYMYKDMADCSIAPNTVTQNIVLSGYGDAKNMDHTFNQMRTKGMKPDTKTFCCLINGFSNAGLFHKVVSMVKLAERLDVPMNTSFHNAVLAACVKAEDLMEMERVFRHMKHLQCVPDATTYSPSCWKLIRRE
ncbi:hypothetical protein ABZP36_034852 [Zizania latifolia]